VSEEVELFVDTGSTFLVVSQTLADRLALVVSRHARVLVAGGRREVWPVAEVRLAIGSAEATTPCFVTSEGPLLLGAVALESLLLAVDTVGKCLVPAEGYALTV